MTTIEQTKPYTIDGVDPRVDCHELLREIEGLMHRYAPSWCCALEDVTEYTNDLGYECAGRSMGERLWLSTIGGKVTVRPLGGEDLVSWTYDRAKREVLAWRAEDPAGAYERDIASGEQVLRQWTGHVANCESRLDDPTHPAYVGDEDRTSACPYGSRTALKKEVAMYSRYAEMTREQIAARRAAGPRTPAEDGRLF